MIASARLAALTSLLVLASAPLGAHDGPPFPIVSNQNAGPYRVSVWTDPDTTDDGTAGGQFWVTFGRIDGGGAPSETRVTVVIRPLGRQGQELRVLASPVRGDVTNQFAALVMDHEGRFAVHVSIDGPLGIAAIDSEVDATYDLRPPPLLVALYVLPFVLVGLIWGRLLIRRRQTKRARSG